MPNNLLHYTESKTKPRYLLRKIKTKYEIQTAHLFHLCMRVSCTTVILMRSKMKKKETRGKWTEKSILFVLFPSKSLLAEHGNISLKFRELCACVMLR